MAKQRKQPEEFKPIRRASLEKVTIYEVLESELEILARGSPGSIILNFAIFLLSVAISFIIALCTTTITSEKVFIVFVIIAVVGLVSGGLLLAIWLRNRKSVSEIVETIKRRLPPEDLQERGSLPPQGS